MKIQSNMVHTAPPSGNAGSKPVKPSLTTPSAAGESVAINPLASQIQSLAQDGAGEMTFDAAKVASLKAAISNGEYKINPEGIADGLVRSSQELLSTQTQS